MKVNLNNTSEVLNAVKEIRSGKLLNGHLETVEKKGFFGKLLGRIVSLFSKSTKTEITTKIEDVLNVIIARLGDAPKTAAVLNARYLVKALQERAKGKDSTFLVKSAADALDHEIEHLQKQEVRSVAIKVSVLNSIKEIEAGMVKLERMVDRIKDSNFTGEITKILTPALEKTRESQEEEQEDIFALFGDEHDLEIEEELKKEKLKQEQLNEMNMIKEDPKKVEEFVSQNIQGIKKDAYVPTQGVKTVSIEEAKVLKKEKDFDNSFLGGLYNAFVGKNTTEEN